MRRVSRPRTAAVLAVVALAGAVGGAAVVGASLSRDTPDSPASIDSQRFIAGYYAPSQLIDLVGQTVDAGTYQISYAADVRFEDPTPGATLSCALRDPNTPALRFEPDSTTTVNATATGATQHVSFTGIYALPPMSFGVRCHSSVAGSVRILFTNIRLDARTG